MAKVDRVLGRDLPLAADSEAAFGNAVPAMAEDKLDLAPLPGLQPDAALKTLKFKQVRSPFSLKGGHNPIHALKDQFGDMWVFKVSFKRTGEFRAIRDRTGSDLAIAAGLDTPRISVAHVMIDGKLQVGTLSRMVNHSGKKLSVDPTQYTDKQKDQLLASHVFRWLIGDHDGKAANFLVLKNGDISPIDFGNIYDRLGSDRLNRTYQPNPIEPVYNRMWEGYVQGKLDLDFNAGLEQITKIEQMPDEQFMQLLQPFVDARYALPGFRQAGLETKEQFMAAAVKRKMQLRTDMTRFYDALAKERGLPGLRSAVVSSALARTGGAQAA